MRANVRMIAVIGTLGTLSLALLFAVALPTAFAIRGLVGNIADAQSQIDARYGLRRYVRASTSTLNSTKQRLASLSTVALQEGHELDLITAIEKAAGAANVTQTLNLEMANQKQLSPWEREVPLNLAVKGSYPDVLRFLNAIERLPQEVVFDVIAITGSQNTTPGDVTATFNGVVYWQGQNAPPFVRGIQLSP